VSGDHAEVPVAARVRALEDQVIAAGLTTDAELDQILASVFTGSPAQGARIVARAWADPGYRERLLADGNAGAAELGLGVSARSGADYRLKVVENTPQLHNVIVCTLCSCYPTSLLGPSPSWYKSVAYRSRVVREPRSVLAEFGLSLPGDVQIAVWDSSAETRYLVLPAQPQAAAGLDQSALAALVTRDGMIGTAAV
jgi:nitrile hydratase